MLSFLGRFARLADGALRVPLRVASCVGLAGETHGAGLLGCWWQIVFPASAGCLLVAYRGGWRAVFARLLHLPPYRSFGHLVKVLVDALIFFCPPCFCLWSWSKLGLFGIVGMCCSPSAVSAPSLGLCGGVLGALWVLVGVLVALLVLFPLEGLLVVI